MQAFGYGFRRAAVVLLFLQLSYSSVFGPATVSFFAYRPIIVHMAHGVIVAQWLVTATCNRQGALQVDCQRLRNLPRHQLRSR
jgi:hypothetical protein